MSEDENDRHDDLIINEGFAVFNNFKPEDDKDNTTKDDPIPRYPFASFNNAVSMPSRESFLQDCFTVFTARTKEESESYSSGETFFLPSLMRPRCALEGLAHAIFHAYVDGLQPESTNGKKNLLYDPERSGAEWWTLVLDTPKADKNKDTKQSKDDEEEEEEDDEVGMHFDADHGLESQMPNFLIHPRIATITYLSDVGVPTLILDKRSPNPSDEEKKSLGGDIERAWLSHPRFGKHVAFDGRMLHGTPGEFFPAVENAGDVAEPMAKRAKVDDKDESNNTTSLSGKRITFLVNIWLNHCPIDAEILDDDVVSNLTTVWEDQTKEEQKADDSYVPPFQCDIKDVTSPDELGEGLKLTKASIKSDGPAGVQEDLIICNRHVTVSFGATMEDFHRASNLAAEKGSAELSLGEGVLTLDVGEEASSDEEDEEDDDS